MDSDKKSSLHINYSSKKFKDDSIQRRVLSQTLNLGDSDKHASLLQHSLMMIVKSFIEIKCDLLGLVK